MNLRWYLSEELELAGRTLFKPIVDKEVMSDKEARNDKKAGSN